MKLEFSTIPIPRDLPLSLPLSETALQVLLVVFFLLHILFVNFIVGGSLLVVFFEWVGLRHRRWDNLAHAIAKTITVNKSMAVVLGIGPLLCINLLYTIQWYSANSLTGHAWLLIIPLVTIAFLLTYLHKYTWDRWAEGRRKKIHFATGILAALLFLSVPLIFLANINLMLFPGSWAKVHGFVSSLMIGNVFQRYIHFMLASVAISSLFLVGCVDHPICGFSKLPHFSASQLKRLFYKGVAIPTSLQFIAGPLLLFSLPGIGLSAKLILVIVFGASLAVIVLWLTRNEIKSPDDEVGKLFLPICVLFSVIVLSMGSGRAIYREAALASHKADIRKRSAEYEVALADFNKNANQSGNSASEKSGEELFATCGACHARDHKLVGPPLTEIAKIYGGNPRGIVTWARAPGKKRPDFPQMPSFAQLGDENLLKIAEYMLEKGGNNNKTAK